MVLICRPIAANGDIKDYELFGIPFITVTDRVFSRIRNLTYRYMPNQQSLFPMETEQYDTWMLRELLNNCIAHSYYQSGERIYVNECEDSIVITNPGSFLPQTVEAVLQPTYNPPFYRNQLLADAMVKFHMIDTATSGIKKVYRIQKEKFFPLPDYTAKYWMKNTHNFYTRTMKALIWKQFFYWIKFKSTFKSQKNKPYD